jgi:hypothetical protein
MKSCLSIVLIKTLHIVKTIAYWDIAPCSLEKQTGISEVHTFSIIRAIKKQKKNGFFNHYDDGGSMDL